MECPVIGPLSRAAQLTGWQTLLLHLLWERAKGQGSFWEAYIAMLPDEQEMSRTHPLMLPDVSEEGRHMRMHVMYACCFPSLSPFLSLSPFALDLSLSPFALDLSLDPLKEMTSAHRASPSASSPGPTASTTAAPAALLSLVSHLSPPLSSVPPFPFFLLSPVPKPFPGGNISTLGCNHSSTSSTALCLLPSLFSHLSSPISLLPSLFSHLSSPISLLPSLFSHLSSPISLLHLSSPISLLPSLFSHLHLSSPISLLPSLFSHLSSPISLLPSLFSHLSSPISLLPSLFSHLSSPISLLPSLFSSSFFHFLPLAPCAPAISRVLSRLKTRLLPLVPQPFPGDDISTPGLTLCLVPWADCLNHSSTATVLSHQVISSSLSHLLSLLPSVPHPQPFPGDDISTPGLTLCLVPWADCLNHSSTATVLSCLTYDPDSRTARLGAHRAYAPGSEVFDSYGPWLSPRQLYLDHGFVDEVVFEGILASNETTLNEAFLREVAGREEREEGEQDEGEEDEEWEGDEMEEVGAEVEQGSWMGFTAHIDHVIELPANTLGKINSTLNASLLEAAGLPIGPPPSSHLSAFDRPPSHLSAAFDRPPSHLSAFDRPPSHHRAPLPPSGPPPTIGPPSHHRAPLPPSGPPPSIGPPSLHRAPLPPSGPPPSIGPPSLTRACWQGWPPLLPHTFTPPLFAPSPLFTPSHLSRSLLPFLLFPTTDSSRFSLTPAGPDDSIVTWLRAALASPAELAAAGWRHVDASDWLSGGRSWRLEQRAAAVMGRIAGGGVTGEETEREVSRGGLGSHGGLEVYLRLISAGQSQLQGYRTTIEEDIALLFNAPRCKEPERWAVAAVLSEKLALLENITVDEDVHLLFRAPQSKAPARWAVAAALSEKLALAGAIQALQRL
ncbi:unnamed protein product [Closterium sp. NIES-64]|nr:unnamed protein product [Closterium sp. NIES-64]